MGCGNSHSIKEKKEDINIYKQIDIKKNKEKDLNIINNNGNKKINYILAKKREEKEKERKEEKEEKEEKKQKNISLKKEQTKGDNKEKEIITKKSQNKIKSYSFLTISQNALDYLPKDITKDEIKQIIYDALRNSIINDKDKYIKGKNLTVEQVNCLMDILYNCVANIDNNKEEEKYQELLGEIKIKIEVLEINKENARKILFKDLDPTDEEIEETLGQFTNSDIPKLFVIELS